MIRALLSDVHDETCVAWRPVQGDGPGKLDVSMCAVGRESRCDGGARRSTKVIVDEQFYRAPNPDRVHVPLHKGIRVLVGTLEQVSLHGEKRVLSVALRCVSILMVPRR